MTANLQIADIITAIGDVIVSGWVICDLTNIPTQPDTRANAVAWPQIENLVTDLSITDATLGGYAAEKDAGYTLNYVMAYKQTGAGRSITEYAAGLVGAAEDLIGAIATTDFSSAGGLEVQPTGITLGIISAPDGTQYYGGFLRLRVLTFVV